MRELIFRSLNSFLVLDDWTGNLNQIGEKIVEVLAKFYDILIVLVPITLLVMGTLDLLKAAGAQDDKGMAAAKSTFGKRAIAAVVALLAMIIAKIIFRVVSGGTWSGFF